MSAFACVCCSLQYAPARAGKTASVSVPSSPATGASNPFLSSSSFSSSSVSSPVAAPASSSSIATTADVSAASFAGVSEADQLAAIRRLYTVINPDKMSQVELMWQKFGAGIWEALSKRYTDVDMNEV